MGPAMAGRKNVALGFLFLAGFMVFGFVLVYLRDFAPGKEQWIAEYAVGKHFESRLAHVHGNLFALLNIVVGYLLMKLPIPAGEARWISWVALAGMLMPVGILGEVLLGTPPAVVLAGGLAMTVAVLWMSWAVFRLRAD